MEITLSPLNGFSFPCLKPLGGHQKKNPHNENYFLTINWYLNFLKIDLPTILVNVDF
jgi:hypothetical protein